MYSIGAIFDMNPGDDSAAIPLHVLLVGSHEAGFSSLRRLFDDACHGEVLLDRASSLEDARARLNHSAYDLLLCYSRPEDGGAIPLVRHMAATLPVIFLDDRLDDAALARILNKLAPSLGEESKSEVACGMCRAIRQYCKEKAGDPGSDMVRKLRHAVEQTNDLMVITDGAGVIEYVNPSFTFLTGYSREEALGKTFRLLQSPLDGPEIYQQMLDTVLAGNRFRKVIHNRKKNGEIFVVEKTITPLRDDNGQITNLISTDRDITEHHKLEAQLQQAQRMDAIGRLAGGVAHDFNNLLMVISSYAELMLDSIVGQHPLRRNIEEIMAASGRAADLTRQLLAFGRQQVQSLRVLDLNPVINDISRMLPHLIGEDIQLVVLQGNNLGKIKADLVQIEQIIMNLAANARDAMPTGGKLTIETSNVHLDQAYLQRRPVVPAGDYVRLAVTDSGNGIAPEHLSHIFEPFYTTKEEGKGTGLGLATVYGIVKQSGGFIWVYSEPGLGTTFKIYLPRVDQKIEHPDVVSPSETPRGWETLLLAEDEPAVRQSEREFLAACGYTVLEALHGEDALRVAQTHPGIIHLMITDVVMPGVDGPTLARRLSVERPEMKVLFVSGYAENTVLQHGLVNMASQFLQKPFTLKSLARKIREVLGSGGIARAASSAG
jgi:PAS domain S-box-containing protein